ncbi:MAG: hypothetical protein JXN10_01075 [Clostridia bacterium]|nr:hypothetical protein [Clostridia bacterium]MBN2882092.1 hypothetical protein [Clostridia bacterium]
MDTKKALTVIIILLLLMNITLGIYLIVINSGRGNFEDTISYTRTILDNRNYKLDCNIPEETIPLSAVQLGENRFTEQSLESVMEKTGGSAYIDDTGVMYYINSGNGTLAPAGTSRIAIEFVASEFLSSIGINREEFVLDYYRETGNESYNLKYVAVDENDILYFNSYVEMQITVEGVQSARIMYPDTEIIHENQGEGIPVYTILLAGLKQTSLEKTIESISSGYYSSGNGIVTANICWRIRFSDGQERFFDAATGKEIK